MPSSAALKQVLSRSAGFVAFLCVLLILALLLSSANCEEPRHWGKYKTLERLRLVEPSWVLPHALVRLRSSSTSSKKLTRANQGPGDSVSATAETREAADAAIAVLQKQQMQQHKQQQQHVRPKEPEPKEPEPKEPEPKEPEEEQVEENEMDKVILKPNKYTSRAHGVCAVARAGVPAALETLRRVLGPVWAPAPVEIFVQAFAPQGCEARLWGTANKEKHTAKAVYIWRDAVAASGEHAPLPAAILERLSRACALAWPRTPALALDVVAPSWECLLRGEFVVLEANGSLGIPFTSANQRSEISARDYYGNVLSWGVSRTALGLQNLLKGKTGLRRALRDVSSGLRHEKSMSRLAAAKDAFELVSVPTWI